MNIKTGESGFNIKFGGLMLTYNRYEWDINEDKACFLCSDKINIEVPGLQHGFYFIKILLTDGSNTYKKVISAYKKTYVF